MNQNLYKLFLKVIRVSSHLWQPMPLFVYSGLGHSLSLIARHLFRDDYRQTEEVLQELLGLSGDVLRKTLNYIFYLRVRRQLDFFLFPALKATTVARITVFSQENLHLIHEFIEASSAKCPLIFVNLHLGNHNWFPPACAINGLPVDVVREGRFGWFNNISAPGKIHFPGKNTKFLIKRLLEGHPLAMTIDVFDPQFMRRVVKTNFLGLEVLWPIGFARLLKTVRGKLIVFFTPRLADDRVYIFFEPVKLPVFYDNPDFELMVVSEVLKKFENYIINHPEQWLRWRYLKKIRAS